MSDNTIQPPEIPCTCNPETGEKCDLHILEEIVADKQELEAEYRKIADAKRLHELEKSEK